MYFFLASLIIYFTPNLSWSSNCGLLSVENQKLVVDELDSRHNLWIEEDRFKLTYCISDRFGIYKELIQNAATEAIDKWSEHANVEFKYVPGEDKDCLRTSKTVFSITRSAKRLPFSMKAFFPNAPRDQRKIRVNERYLNRTNFIKNTMLHEFGHVLGFRHEQIHPESSSRCSEAGTSSPVTDYDINSIMHYRSCGGTSYGDRLSELDKFGAQLMYP